MYIQLFAEISERRGLSKSAQAELVLSSTSSLVEGDEMGEFNSRASLKLTHIPEAPLPASLRAYLGEGLG